jgi:osmotically-inducible protein OsmY
MITDDDLRATVQTELNWEPSLSAADIGVAAKNGVVTLTGHVPTYAEKFAAEAATRRVKGVKAIAEELKVRLPQSINHNDTDISGAIVQRFKWDLQVPADRVKATVEKGHVTLTGDVDWRYQKEAAELEVRYLSGVTGVTNAITLKPRVDTKNIAHDIDSAMGRSWFFDPETIKVTAEGGRVKLTGTARSPGDRILAADAAWAAPGTTFVENDIRVL